MLKNFIKIFVVAILASQILGCAIVGNMIGKDLVPAIIAQTMGITIPSKVFYKYENRWPQNIDELRTFAEKNKLDKLDKIDMPKTDIPIIPITHPRFDGAKFTTLPDGDLEVKLVDYQGWGEWAFKISKQVE